MKFEYYVHALQSGTAAGQQDELNRLGAGNWELVSVVGSRAYLRRAVAAVMDTAPTVLAQPVNRTPQPNWQKSKRA